MKLSLKEYDAMQSDWRKWINEHMEIGGFKTWGMDFTGKDILEVGCGSGYSASLIVKDHPKSYTGMDIMPEQLRYYHSLAHDRRAVPWKEERRKCLKAGRSPQSLIFRALRAFFCFWEYGIIFV